MVYKKCNTHTYIEIIALLRVYIYLYIYMHVQLPSAIARVSRYNGGCWTMYPVSLDFPYVLLEREEINSILYKPINSTQRIKVRCG